MFMKPMHVKVNILINIKLYCSYKSRVMQKAHIAYVQGVFIIESPAYLYMQFLKIFSYKVSSLTISLRFSGRLQNRSYRHLHFAHASPDLSYPTR